MNNQLKVSLENIIPLTEARDHFSQIVAEVQKDKLYVLTKGGKPAVSIVDVKYLEAITGGKIRQDHIENEIQKEPEKVGRPKMIEHKADENSPKTLTMPISNDLPPLTQAAQVNSINNQTNRTPGFSPYNQSTASPLIPPKPTTPSSFNPIPVAKPPVNPSASPSTPPALSQTNYSQSVSNSSNSDGSTVKSTSPILTASNTPNTPDKPAVTYSATPVASNQNAVNSTQATPPTSNHVNPPLSNGPTYTPNASASPVSSISSTITPKTLTSYPTANNTPTTTTAQPNQTPVAQTSASTQAPIPSPSVAPAVSIPPTAIPSAPSSNSSNTAEIKPTVSPINSAPMWQAQPSINNTASPASQTTPSTIPSQANPLSTPIPVSPTSNQTQTQLPASSTTNSSVATTVSKDAVVVEVTAAPDEELMAKAAKDDQQTKDTFGSSTSEDKPGPAQFAGDSTEEVDDMMLD